MHVLRAALNRNEALRRRVLNLVREIGSNPCLHGVVLDLNPFWVSQAMAYGPPYDWPWEGDPELLFSLVDLPMDWSRRRAAWDFGGGTANKAVVSRDTEHPFILKVSASRKPLRNGRSDERRGLRDIQRAVMDWPIPATLTVKPAPRLLYGPPIRCRTGSGAAGTIGGFLYDRYSRQTFAATCGHVLPAGELRAAGLSLGPCAYAAAPAILPPDETCCASCTHAVELDLALAPVLGGDVPPQPAVVAPRIAPRQRVTMQGATSGKRRYAIGGVGMMHFIGGVCWEGLVELRQPARSSVLHPAFRALFRRPPQAGDSGSWIITEAGEWAGVVVAGDFEMGYALEAETTLSKANSAFETDLVLPT